MKSFRRKTLPIVKLHPLSVKAIKSGHYYITSDKFSDRFPTNEKFLAVDDQKSRLKAILLHDPKHKNIKARLWQKNCKNLKECINSFQNDLSSRINVAIQKRKDMELTVSRENFYLIFGETDKIPGVMVQLLSNKILIQIYSNFWDHYEEQLIKYIQKSFTFFFKDITSLEIFLQKRSVKSLATLRKVYPKRQKLSKEILFPIREYGVKYLIKLQESLDFGIYTDMSSVRGELIPIFKETKSVLNLFSYTGSFSLNALFHGAERVVSVDISETYNKWLQDNIELNSFDKSKHQMVHMPVQKFIKKKNSFDLVICDPPSFSSDGKKTLNAMGLYESYLKDLINLVAKDGYLLIFLNTHKTSFKKFVDRISKIISNHKNGDNFTLIKRLKLTDDCPTAKGFTEGDYLKGLLFKNSKG